MSNILEFQRRKKNTLIFARNKNLFKNNVFQHELKKKICSQNQEKKDIEINAKFKLVIIQKLFEKKINNIKTIIFNVINTLIFIASFKLQH